MKGEAQESSDFSSTESGLVPEGESGVMLPACSNV